MTGGQLETAAAPSIAAAVARLYLAPIRDSVRVVDGTRGTPLAQLTAGQAAHWAFVIAYVGLSTAVAARLAAGLLIAAACPRR